MSEVPLCRKWLGMRRSKTVESTSHAIIVMIRWTSLAPWEFESPFPGSLTSTFRNLQDMGYAPFQDGREHGKPRFAFGAAAGHPHGDHLIQVLRLPPAC